MSGTGVAELQRRRIDDADDRGDDPRILAAQQHAIRAPQRVGRPRAVDERAANRLAHGVHRDDGGDAAPAGIADRDRERAVIEEEGVVEIAAAGVVLRVAGRIRPRDAQAVDDRRVGRAAARSAARAVSSPHNADRHRRNAQRGSIGSIGRTAHQRDRADHRNDDQDEQRGREAGSGLHFAFPSPCSAREKGTAACSVREHCRGRTRISELVEITDQEQRHDVEDLDHRVDRRARRVFVRIADRIAGHGRRVRG